MYVHACRTLFFVLARTVLLDGTPGGPPPELLPPLAPPLVAPPAPVDGVATFRFFATNVLGSL